MSPRPATSSSSVRTAPSSTSRSRNVNRMTTVTSSVSDACAAAKRASLTLQTLPSGIRDGALVAIAAALEDRAGEVLDANAADLQEARGGDYSGAFLDKLRLDEARLATMVA